MARWLVNRNDTQLVADGMAELRAWARAGRLGPGDMIQPPGATDWLYAAEIPELQDDLKAGAAHAADDLDDVPRSGGAGRIVLAVVAVLALAGGAYGILEYAGRIPADQRSLLEKLSFSEMVVTTDGVRLHAEPSPGAGGAAVAKGTVLELLAKRGDFYRAKQKSGGGEGWVPVDAVLPMYLIGGGDVMEKYDPLYNPDRYLVVANASWMQLPEQTGDTLVTVFQFMLLNNSDYDMTDLVLVAQLKDGKGQDLDEVEFRVEGVVPAHGSTMVGTIVPKDDGERRLVTQYTFDRMANADPELRLEYTDGVEVTTEVREFTDARVDVAELRSIPNES